VVEDLEGLAMTGHVLSIGYTANLSNTPIAASEDLTPHELAKALGGSFNRKWYNIPGPGHSSADRSLGFYFDPLQPAEIGIFSFAGDDPDICRKHVINKLSFLSGGVLPFIELKAHEALDRASIDTKALSVWDAAAGHG
jgi:hypothetical protein